jgi:hypothetical protein
MKKIRLGFTGTRKGMTNRQLLSFLETVKIFAKARIIKEFHHENYIGADKETHDKMINISGCEVIVHFAKIKSPMIAKLEGDFWRMPSKPPLERNKDIVDETDNLIACPDSSKEKLRSGTWATIRYAKKKNKAVVIVFPNGEVEIA